MRRFLSLFPRKAMACFPLSALHFLLPVLLVSCQKELCYHHPHEYGDNHGQLHVVFDWSETQNPSATEMYLVAFAGGRNAVTYPLTGMTGGDVSLWGGQYWFVAYNSDTETMATRGSTYDDFEVYGVDRDLTRYVMDFRAHAASITRCGTHSAEADESLHFIWEPERLWVSTDRDVTVVPGTEQTLVMKMWAATYQYTFLIRNVANLDRVSSISATLSGLASGYSLAQRQPIDYTVAEIFSFHKVDASSIRGTLRVFGHSPEDDAAGNTDATDPLIPGPAYARQNYLTLFVTMDNGNPLVLQSETKRVRTLNIS